MRKGDKHRNDVRVLWVGLSDKPSKSGEVFSPLSITTTSGKLIAEIERRMPYVQFSKTNLVKMAPLDGSGKLRYPTRAECVIYYPQLCAEIDALRPDFVFLLGKQVAEFMLAKLDPGMYQHPSTFSYMVVRVDNIGYVAIHHPSYVAVYKRKEKQQYCDAIRDLILSKDATSHTKVSAWQK